MTKVDELDGIADSPVKVINMYLSRSGRGGYIIRMEIIPMEGKLKRLEKRYPTKQFGQMRGAVARLVESIVEKGIPRSTIKFQSGLLNFNSLI